MRDAITTALLRENCGSVVPNEILPILGWEPSHNNFTAAPPYQPTDERVSERERRNQFRGPSHCESASRIVKISEWRNENRK